MSAAAAERIQRLKNISANVMIDEQYHNKSRGV